MKFFLILTILFVFSFSQEYQLSTVFVYGNDNDTVEVGNFSDKINFIEINLESLYDSSVYREGFSIIKLRNGARCECNFNNGHITDGLIFYSDGMYDGEISNYRANGNGKYTFKNGNKYEGKFFRGKFHGEGKLVTKKGEIYTGSFQNGLFHGKGELLTNDFLFDGDFIKGQAREGLLSINNAEGLISMIGTFNKTDNAKHPALKKMKIKIVGNGYEESKKYGSFSGVYKNSLPNGSGLSLYYGLNGESFSYKGEWLNGLPHGYGIRFFPVGVSDIFRAGAKIEGEFVNGKPNGVMKVFVPLRGEFKAKIFEAEVKNNKIYKYIGKEYQIQDAYTNPSAVINIGTKNYKLSATSLLQIKDFYNDFKQYKFFNKVLALAPFIKLVDDSIPNTPPVKKASHLLAINTIPVIFNEISTKNEWDAYKGALDGANYLYKHKLKMFIYSNYLYHSHTKGDDKRFWYDMATALSLDSIM